MGEPSKNYFKEYSAERMIPSEGRNEGPVDLKRVNCIADGDRRNLMIVTSMEEMVAACSSLSRLSVTMRARNAYFTQDYFQHPIRT